MVDFSRQWPYTLKSPRSHGGFAVQHEGFLVLTGAYGDDKREIVDGIAFEGVGQRAKLNASIWLGDEYHSPLDHLGFS